VVEEGRATVVVVVSHEMEKEFSEKSPSLLFSPEQSRQATLQDLLREVRFTYN